MARATGFKAAWILVALVMAAGCEGRYRCQRAPDGEPNCSQLCERYCEKVETCGRDAGPRCQPDCIARTEAGGETYNYSCVIEEACEDSVNCSI